MSKDDQNILVVKKNILFGEDYFEGFRYYGEVDYEQRMIENLEVMRRGDAEINPDYKQPIGYTIAVNSLEKKVFVYQRSSKDKDYGEKRLMGKWSCGIGGHIEDFEKDEINPIQISTEREFSEEVEIEGGIIATKLLGYINDDTNEVGKVHFGIVYIMELSGDIKPLGSEMANGRLIDVGELERMCSSSEYNIEEWTRLSLSPLIRYFG